MTENQVAAPSVAQPVSAGNGVVKGKPLSVPEAANLLGVDPAKIYEWLSQGKLRPASLTLGAGEGGQGGQAMVLPVDPKLVERWNGGGGNHQKPESESAFLKGRITELEKSLAWERDVRAKVEGEISLLKQEKAGLEERLALSTKVEKSLQKYTDRLEQELKIEHEKGSLKAS